LRAAVASEKDPAAAVVSQYHAAARASATAANEDGAAAFIDNDDDFVSHLCLRLAVASQGNASSSNHALKWFLMAEGRLFQARLTHWLAAMTTTTTDHKLHFSEEWWRHTYGLAFRRENDSGDDDDGGGCVREWQEAIAPQTLSSTSSPSTPALALDYFRVPFPEAASLVKRRLVVLSGGFALVPAHQMPEVVTAAYRASMAHKVGSVRLFFF
jgi:hypothetical protein